MAPRLSGKNSMFGGVFFVFKCLLGIERQRKLKKLQFWPESLGSMLEYWYIERGLSFILCRASHGFHVFASSSDWFTELFAFAVITSVSVLRMSLFITRRRKWETCRISTGNSMDESVVKDLHCERYLKILSKLHEPLGECNLKEFANFMSSVNP